MLCWPVLDNKAGGSGYNSHSGMLAPTLSQLSRKKLCTASLLKRKMKKRFSHSAAGRRKGKEPAFWSCSKYLIPFNDLEQ